MQGKEKYANYVIQSSQIFIQTTNVTTLLKCQTMDVHLR